MKRERLYRHLGIEESNRQEPRQRGYPPLRWLGVGQRVMQYQMTRRPIVIDPEHRRRIRRAILARQRAHRLATHRTGQGAIALGNTLDRMKTS